MNANELTPEADVEHHLAQLGAYFASKIRTDDKADTEIELYCSLNRIRDYFKTMRLLITDYEAQLKKQKEN